MASPPDPPLVSAIIATRDRPRLLSIALDCYASQTYPNRELIVVDDGEDAPADAAAVAGVGGRLIRVEAGTPLGQKLNVGAEAARGLFCQKMDDDDWYAPAFIETMVANVLESWTVVCRPTLAVLMGFLFFDVARWEVRRSTPENAPGATLFFMREQWEEHPFRGVPRDEDVWFYMDQIRHGGTCVTVDTPEMFLAVRHSGSSSDRGHTWTRQLDGQRLETYMLDLPLHEGGPESLLPTWAVERYRAIQADLVRQATAE
jgi:glycosyltransferase involved in cell wall biosynthesis